MATRGLATENQMWKGLKKHLTSPRSAAAQRGGEACSESHSLSWSKWEQEILFLFFMPCSTYHAVFQREAFVSRPSKNPRFVEVSPNEGKKKRQ